MHKQFLLLTAILLVFVVESPVMAEIKGKEVTVSPFVGAYIFDGSQSLDPSLAAGMRLGINLDKNWGLEGQFSYAWLKNAGKYGGLYNVSGDLLYHFIPEGRVVPYLMVGAGLSKTDYVIATKNNGLVEYGVGIKYFISNAVALRWDARQIYLLSRNNISASTDYWQNSEFTVGLSFQFGGTKSVSPALKEIVPAAAAVHPAEPEPKAAKEETVKVESVQEESLNFQAENVIAPAGKTTFGLK